MATEVSCGHCHGRLLVETLGVVVACPHCGTHLSIPAPSPAPFPAPVTPAPAVPEPAPAQFEPAPTFPTFSAAPPVPPVTLPTFSGAAPILQDTMPTVAETAPSFSAVPPAMFSPAPTPPDLSAAESAAAATAEAEHHAVSVFGTPDEQSADLSPGWHSAPRLELGPQTPGSAIQPDFTVTGAAEQPATTEQVATPPVFTPPEAETAVPAAFQGAEFNLSSSQQFSLTAIEAAATSAPPFAAVTQQAAATPGPLNFGAPPAAQPLTFGGAPLQASPSAPLTFGAPPATPAAPPLTFGAAFTGMSQQPGSEAQAGSEASVVRSPTVAEEAASFAENEFESRQKFLMILLIVIGSYASAITIVLVYMLMFSRTSALESLPDLVPAVNKNGDISWKYNPPKNNLPPGHVLSLGQSCRYGNVRVTPLKVTRGPVKFEHYSGEPGLARDPSEPLLKLWVRFENVSSDQSFAPVDAHLLYTRKVINLGESTQANGFIAVEADRKRGKSLFYMFDTPILSEFRMIGQNLNRRLQPGESLETFIPSEEDARNLKGDLVWRFQFRKGHHPQSMRGVTTLIDVQFNSSDIVDEA